eukprot:tig00020902_g15036.t1
MILGSSDYYASVGFTFRGSEAIWDEAMGAGTTQVSPSEILSKAAVTGGAPIGSVDTIASFVSRYDSLPVGDKDGNLDKGEFLHCLAPILVDDPNNPARLDEPMAEVETEGAYEAELELSEEAEAAEAAAAMANLAGEEAPALASGF